MSMASDHFGAALVAPVYAGADGPPPGTYSGIFAFGDSLSDAGNDYIASFGVLPSSPPYSDGRFSNGAVWVQDLAKILHLHVPQPSLNGGTDYAYGGAETGKTPDHSLNPIDLPSQLAQFVANEGFAPSQALYTLTIGANDVIDALPTYDTNPQAGIADVQAAVSNEIGFIGNLAALGAHNFLIMNVPDLGKTPEEAGDSANASTLSSIYDNDLQTALTTLAAQDHLAAHVLNAYALIDAAVANPSQFGFTNVTTPLWTGNYTDPNSGTFTAHGAQAKGYLFFDHLHPTAFGHMEIALQGAQVL